MESKQGIKNHTEGLSDEIFDLLCSPCKVKNRNTEAKKYCVDCHDYYCCTCVKCHEDIPALARHKILEKDEFETLIHHELPPVPTERCEEHKHKVIDMYCQTHDGVGCVTCMAVDHRECQGIFFIPKFLKDDRNSLDFQPIKDDLETTAQRLTQHQGEIERHETRALSRKDAVIRKIKRTREVVREKVDKVEQDALDDAEVKYKPVLEEIAEEMRLLQAIRSDVLSALNNVESAGSNISQVFVLAKKSKNIVKEAGQYTAESVAKLKTEDVDTLSDQKLLGLLHAIEGLDDIGEERSIAAGRKKSGIAERDNLHDEPRKVRIANITEGYKQDADEDCTSIDAYSTDKNTKRDIHKVKGEDENKVFENDKGNEGNKERNDLEVETATFKSITNTGAEKCNTKEKGSKDGKLFQETTSADSEVLKRPTSVDETKLFQAKPSSNSGATKRATSMIENKTGSLTSDAINTYDMNAVKKYNIRLQSDTKDCCITDICPLDDGSFILADYGNKKLKRLESKTYTVKDYCNLPSPPWQVCSVNKQEVVVSYWGNVTAIHFVTVGGKMEKTKQIETYHGCIGVSCGDGKIFTSDTTSVYVYTMSGTKIKQFPRDQSMQKIFSKISSIAVSSDGSKIYVADSHKGLIQLDRNGNVVGRYDGSELQGARDTCINDDGGVVVCGSGSNNVLRFGPNCDLITEIIKSKGSDRKCQAIWYSTKHAKLIVGREGCDHIEVFV